VYLLTTALQGVVREGTAQALSNWLPPEIKAAGKTGTTDDLRDSWFAGYTGDRVAVVWVGRDDNKPTGLTGGSGALTIWGEMMKNIRPEPLEPVMPEDVELVTVDADSGVRYEEGCTSGIVLPFIKGSTPVEIVPCPTAIAEVPKAGDNTGASAEIMPEVEVKEKSGEKRDSDNKNWLQRLFN
jgi:penicillin-binding protein 1B